MAAPRLFHIATLDEWHAAGADYSPAAFTHAGFIHCSHLEQVEATRARHYGGRDDLVLLEIDPDRLSSPVIVEPSPTTGERYPHVYGRIERTAVAAVHPFVEGDGFANVG